MVSSADSLRSELIAILKRDEICNALWNESQTWAFSMSFNITGYNVSDLSVAEKEKFQLVYHYYIDHHITDVIVVSFPASPGHELFIGIGTNPRRPYTSPLLKQYLQVGMGVGDTLYESIRGIWN